MKKRVMSAITLFLFACILMMQIAQAAESRAVKSSVDLSFNGTTAICSAVCIGDSSTDKIEATLTLYQGSTVIDSWSDSGNWSVTLTGEHKVTSGKSYRLELAYSVNGIKQSAVTATNTCP